MTEEKYVRVRNLMDNKVGYSIEEEHILRIFQPREVKLLSESELRKAAYQEGVQVLLRDYLCVEDEELAQELAGVAPDVIEYKWDVNKVDDVLLNEPIEVLLDALDFAPAGIKDLIVKRAVETELNDVSKRKAITEKTGQDIDNMIQYFQEEQAEAANKGEVKNKTRRVKPTPSAEEIKPTRRVVETE